MHATDEELALYSKAYDHGKEAGYKKGIEDAYTAFSNNPSLFAPPPQNKTPDNPLKIDGLLKTPVDAKS